MRRLRTCLVATALGGILAAPLAATSAHAAAAPFSTFLLHEGTPIPAAEVDASYTWTAGDRTGDGIAELIGVRTRNAGSLVRVDWTQRPGQEWPGWLQSDTPIAGADGDANFKWTAADFQADGFADVFAIETRNTGTDQVELHLLDGRLPNWPFWLQRAIPIAAADGDSNFACAAGDVDGDCIADLLAIKTRNTGSGQVEVHALSGASRFQTFVLHRRTPIAAADGDANFNWATGDVNRDGHTDLLGIKTRNTGTGRVEVHALDGRWGYLTFLVQTDTPITAADGDANFEWAAGDLNRDGVADLYGIKTRTPPRTKSKCTD